ncbi:MAG: J domain-containing protein, partial [Magnetospirillum sp.]|nr:J domain-containing protein [Magnetospirillum sp.]
MALRLILVLAAILGIWWALRWWSKAPPDQARKTLIAAIMILLVVGGIALVATGKLGGLFAIAAGLSPWISRALRLHGFWRTIQRMRGKGQEPPSAAAPPPPDSAMTPAQAYEILGLAPGATPEQIREAHRRLMRANHP